MPETIFTVSVMRQPSPPTGCRTWGWYPEIGQAQACVLENRSDIHETNFDYAVIEEISPGLSSLPRREWWACWNGQAYEPCVRPRMAGSTVCWSMG